MNVSKRTAAATTAPPIDGANRHWARAAGASASTV
jgi:hypothetical protein